MDMCHPNLHFFGTKANEHTRCRCGALRFGDIFYSKDAAILGIKEYEAKKRRKEFKLIRGGKYGL